jgi:hypothetical protein
MKLIVSEIFALFFENPGLYEKTVCGPNEKKDENLIPTFTDKKSVRKNLSSYTMQLHMLFLSRDIYIISDESPAG